MSDNTVELLRSQYDGKTLAVCVNGIRHGPDLGPWSILWSEPTDIRVHEEEDETLMKIAAIAVQLGYTDVQDLIAERHPELYRKATT